MAKHNERVIVDVRDLFAVSSENINNSRNSWENYVNEDDERSLNDDSNCLNKQLFSAADNNFILSNSPRDNNFILSKPTRDDNFLLSTPQKNDNFILSKSPRDASSVFALKASEYNDAKTQQNLCFDSFDEKNRINKNAKEGDLTDFDINGFVSSYLSNGSDVKSNLLLEGGETTPDIHLSEQEKDDSRETPILKVRSSNSKSETFGVKTDRWTKDQSDNLNSVTEDENYPHLKKIDIEFDEDEMTLEFGEESAETKSPKLFVEYSGDDFSDYIQEEKRDETIMKNSSNKNKSSKKNTQLTNLLEVTTSGKVSPRGDGTETKKSPGFKERLSNTFGFPSRRKKEKPPKKKYSTSSIRNFAYIDSKMGHGDFYNVDFREEQTLDRDTTRGYDNGSDISGRDGTRNVVESAPSSFSQRQYWSEDSFISNNLESNSDVSFKSRPLVPNSNGQDVTSVIQNGTEPNNTHNDILSDFESNRKMQLYGSTGKKVQKQQSVLKKLTGGFKKKTNQRPNEPDVSEIVKNTVFNPLSDSSDVQL